MGRQIVRVNGVVIRARRLGETSKLVTLYTAEQGKLKVTAKGARQPRSRYGAALELFTQVQAICYLRDERELQTLGECDIVAQHGALLASLERLAYASAACELIDRLTLEGEPNPRLFQCLTGMLAALAEVGLGQLEALFWYFELRVAAALGFRPELVACVACRRAQVGAWWWFSAAAGGILCPDCGAGRGIRLAESSRRLLVELQGLRRYRRESIPAATPPPAEIRAALGSFLEYHGGARTSLRALDFLRAVHDGPPPPGASPVPAGARGERDAGDAGAAGAAERRGTSI